MTEPSASLSLRGYRAVKRTYRGARTAARRINASRRQLPSFLILGAAKAGTTSLHHHLVDHPQVSEPTIKEIHYFDQAYHRGPGWYRAHFEPCRAPEEITGESTPYYLFHPLVPERVARNLPEAKLIALLRNPIDRAYSHHNHECASSYENLPFDEAVEREEERLRGEEERMVRDHRYRSFSHQHHSYLARGRYAEQLERWFEQVGRERILVLGAEDLFEDPAGAVEAVQRFLDLEPLPPSDLAPRNVRSYSPIPGKLRAKLKTIFEPHNQRLYELLGRDFGWD
jgi:hypothetical protein